MEQTILTIYNRHTEAAALNVTLVQRQIVERSPLLAAMLDAGEIALTGGIYDVETGRVEFKESVVPEAAR